MKMNKINWAVIPVAGMGTRMLPMSKAFPKELIPLIDRPLIDWILEEVYLAGIRRVVLVTHPDKSSIQSYLTPDNYLKEMLKAKGKQDLISLLERSKVSELDIQYVNQMQPLGLGHAINCARPIIGNEGFAVLLPDVVIFKQDQAETGLMLHQMVQYTEGNNTSALLVEQVPHEKTSSYGIVELEQDGLMIRSMVEKPHPDEAPSDLAIVGRYVFTPGVWEFLGSDKKGSGGEIQLTDAIDNLLEKENVFASVLQERTFDCGDKLGYLHAQLTLSLESEAYGDSLHRLLEHR